MEEIAVRRLRRHGRPLRTVEKSALTAKTAAREVVARVLWSSRPTTSGWPVRSSDGRRGWLVRALEDVVIVDLDRR
jgi:hypothetical protein